MFELYQLEQLVAIHRCGTFSGAARELFISQPALSRSMQKLEKELGFPLFEHGKNKVTMTPTGELAVSYARELLRRAGEMQTQLSLYYKTRNTVSIGSCAPAPLWDLVPMLSERYPDMAIASEIQSDKDVLVRKLEEGVYKLIATVGPVEDDNICSVPFLDENLYFTVPNGHELSSRNELYLRELKNLTIILHSRIGFWYDLCCREMVNPNFIMQEDFNQYLTLASSSSLPSFITDVSWARYRHTEGHTDDFHMIHILDPEANVTFYCSCLKENEEYLPPAGLSRK